MSKSNLNQPSKIRGLLFAHDLEIVLYKRANFTAAQMHENI